MTKCAKLGKPRFRKEASKTKFSTYFGVKGAVMRAARKSTYPRICDLLPTPFVINGFFLFWLGWWGIPISQLNSCTAIGIEQKLL
jgi:hypothetical protein